MIQSLGWSCLFFSCTHDELWHKCTTWLTNRSRALWECHHPASQVCWIYCEGWALRFFIFIFIFLQSPPSVCLNADGLFFSGLRFFQDFSLLILTVLRIYRWPLLWILKSNALMATPCNSKDTGHAARVAVQISGHVLLLYSCMRCFAWIVPENAQKNVKHRPFALDKGSCWVRGWCTNICETFIHMQACVLSLTHTCMHTHRHTYTHMQVCVCLRVCAHTHTHIRFNSA